MLLHVVSMRVPLYNLPPTPALGAAKTIQRKGQVKSYSPVGVQQYPSSKSGKQEEKPFQKEARSVCVCRRSSMTSSFVEAGWHGCARAQVWPWQARGSRFVSCAFFSLVYGRLFCSVARCSVVLLKPSQVRCIGDRITLLAANIPRPMQSGGKSCARLQRG